MLFGVIVLASYFYRFVESEHYERRCDRLRSYLRALTLMPSINLAKAHRNPVNFMGLDATVYTNRYIDRLWISLF